MNSYYEFFHREEGEREKERDERKRNGELKRSACSRRARKVSEREDNSERLRLRKSEKTGARIIIPLFIKFIRGLDLLYYRKSWLLMPDACLWPLLNNTRKDKQIQASKYSSCLFPRFQRGQFGRTSRSHSRLHKEHHRHLLCRLPCHCHRRF